MSHNPRLYAVIDPASPRYPGWCADLGCDFVPISSAVAGPIDYGDGKGPAMCYPVDMEALSPAQLRAVVSSSAAINGVSFDEALICFVEFGMHLDEREVIVCEDPNEGRLRFPFWSGVGPRKGVTP